MSQSMLFLHRAPGPLLRPWVRALWYCRAPGLPHRRERILPNGDMQIILDLTTGDRAGGEERKVGERRPAAIVVGARARYQVIDTTVMEELAGVWFQPGGFAGLFGERADLFFEQSIALDDVWTGSRLAERLCEVAAPAEKLRTLEALLSGLLQQRPRRSPLVEQALDLFRGQALSVAGCARAAGVSERRLSQVFREQVGLGPKLWCRVRRFQRAVQALHRGADVPWAELALECGYYDQSHFANDFQAFSGINPTTYSAGRGPWQNHLPLS